MKPIDRDFFYEMLHTPSPTGGEQALQRKIHDHYRDIADEVRPDVHGNLFLTLNPGRPKKVMLAGHCDQIAFMVKHVSKDGYLFLDTLGGADYGVVLGEHLLIHTKSGPLEGVVGRKPKHAQTSEETKQIPPSHKIWVDIGARDDGQVFERVRVGDYITFKPRVLELQNDFIASPAMDNKAGLFICLETLRRCRERKCDVTLSVVSTVQEEIGSRGAASATSQLSPDVGIAMDTIPATDDPGYDLPVEQTVPCKLGSGPTISTGPNTNPVVGQMLVAAADKLKVAWQPDPSGKTAPNDSNMMQIGDSGVATASVGLPLRNMHTQVEIISWSDLQACIDVLVEFTCSVKNDTDFRPFYFRRS
ncbi:MAG TPA: M20/M25/M40 family metallo-hydrolase [Tepidisphaeraceae bacterium]